MAGPSDRSVEITRESLGHYEAVNPRGGRLRFSAGESEDFTPVELLLTALAGCGAIDVDLITGKRAAASSFQVRATGDKVRDEGGNHLTNLRVTFEITWPEGEEGDLAREVLPRTLAQVRDRLCTVSRTVTLGEPVEFEAT